MEASQTIPWHQPPLSASLSVPQMDLSGTNERESDEHIRMRETLSSNYFDHNLRL